MTPMFLVHAIFAMIAIVLIPTVAYAWGPGVHVDVAIAVLAKIGLAAPFIRELVRRFPDAFIYGAASPDIIVGKKYAGYLYHCHNWRIGWLILHEATNDRQRAAAYGYLMHLAADTVAHNYYIPAKIVRSWGARFLTHTYWEMRFDLGVPEVAWDRLEAIDKLEIEEFDKVLERVLKLTFLSFPTNKRIFNTILILQKMRGVRASLELYAKHSRFELGEENRQHYVDLTMEVAMDFLRRPDSADCLEIDPAGIEKLAYAKDLRRSIRAMVARGLVAPAEAEKLVEFVRERLAIGLYRPKMPLPDVVDMV